MNSLRRPLKKSLVLFVTTYLCAGAFVHAQLLAPSDEIGSPTSKAERAHRVAINAKFDDDSKLLLKLDEPQLTGAGSGESNCRFRIDPIPAAEADVILVGQVAKYQSFFSNDHTRIYTDFSLLPEEILKAYSPQTSYQVVMPGGAIKKSNGKLVSYRADDPELLLPGKRYVLFLKYDYPTGTYAAFKQWELLNGHPQPISHEDLHDVRQGRSKIVTLSETDFISAIRSTINSH